MTFESIKTAELKTALFESIKTVDLKTALLCTGSQAAQLAGSLNIRSRTNSIIINMYIYILVKQFSSIIRKNSEWCYFETQCSGQCYFGTQCQFSRIEFEIITYVLVQYKKHNFDHIRNDLLKLLQKETCKFVAMYYGSKPSDSCKQINLIKLINRRLSITHDQIHT